MFDCHDCFAGNKETCEGNPSGSGSLVANRFRGYMKAGTSYPGFFQLLCASILKPSKRLHKIRCRFKKSLTAELAENAEII